MKPTKERMERISLSRTSYGALLEGCLFQLEQDFFFYFFAASYFSFFHSWIRKFRWLGQLMVVSPHLSVTCSSSNISQSKLELALQVQSELAKGLLFLVFL